MMLRSLEENGWLIRLMIFPERGTQSYYSNIKRAMNDKHFDNSQRQIIRLKKKEFISLYTTSHQLPQAV